MVGILGAIIWYLLVSALGLLTFWLAFRLFPGLQDRGYAFSRALGLLLWGYLFWLLSSFGILANTTGGYLFALVVLVALALWAGRRNGQSEFFAWIKEHQTYLVAIEMTFVLAFVFLLWLRGMEPALIGTEKPMELAFIQAVMRSPSMPPLDPWLADYAISYYYYGYVIVAMLAKLSGVSAGIAFNLGISLVFALAAAGAYGVVYNLLAALQPERRLSNALSALLAPLFALIVSNAEGFLEFLHGKGLFWTQAQGGVWKSSFWTWLGIKDLVDAPLYNTAGDGLRFWWWWRASRVVMDYDFHGNFKEVIDEFPFFSYFLGDLHPHVLSMPFVFVALALALNLYFSRQEVTKRFRLVGLDYLFTTETFILGAVVFGGLGFLNIWDFPWYVGIFAGAHLLRKADAEGWRWERLWELLVLGVAFVLAGALAYLPYYLGFSSQAGGILPNVVNPTRGAQLWVMFGTLFLPLFALLLFLVIKKRSRRALAYGIGLALAGTVVLLAFSLLLTYLLGNIPPEFEFNSFLQLYDVPQVGVLLQEGLARRAATLGGAITLVVLLGLALAVLWPARQADEHPRLAPSHQFAMLLVLVGGLLVLAPEFVYLRDQFATRMNTVFKFYYQAWLLWAIAAAYGSALLLALPRRRAAGWAFTSLLVLVLAVGLAYPYMAVYSRASAHSLEQKLTLDGTDNYAYLDQDEKAAVAWLQQAPLGTLVEAVGGSYSEYARISMHSGQPALLGWVGHEGQWRGGMDEVGNRQADIALLYTTGLWDEAAYIIKLYHIRYVVVGNLEHSTYQVFEDKFYRHLTPVFQQGSITIFETSGLDD